ncbi:MAG: hypothetical protein LBM69_07965 [Lachnospiraceae bacterium]|nr:hypothetical protein [Lachnospiraceae bacterium]
MANHKTSRRTKHEKERKEKKSILPGAVVVAFIAAMLVYFMLISIEKDALSAYEKEMIYVAATDIESGVYLTDSNWMSYFEQKEIDKNMIPPQAIQNEAAFYDKYIESQIDKGAIMTHSMITSLEKITANITNPVVAAIKADDLAQLCNGILRSGDQIHIFSVTKDKVAEFMWQNVYVWQVFDAAGTMILPGDSITAASRINVLLDESTIEHFYSELAAGTIRIVKVATEDIDIVRAQ